MARKGTDRFSGGNDRPILTDVSNPVTPPQMRLQKWRQKHGYTLEQVGEMLGVTKSTVSRYESFQRFPELAVLKRIRQVTAGRVTADDFVAADKEVA